MFGTYQLPNLWMTDLQLRVCPSISGGWSGAGGVRSVDLEKFICGHYGGWRPAKAAGLKVCQRRDEWITTDPAVNMFRAAICCVGMITA